MKIKILVAVCLGLVPFILAAQPVLPSDVKNMPILIELPLSNGKFGHGTGAYLYSSNNGFLVIAAHCIFTQNPTNRNELISSNATASAFVYQNDWLKNEFTLDLDQLKRDGNIKRHPTHDVAVIRLARITTPYTNTEEITVLSTGVGGVARSAFRCAPRPVERGCDDYCGALVDSRLEG